MNVGWSLDVVGRCEPLLLAVVVGRRCWPSLLDVVVGRRCWTLLDVRPLFGRWTTLEALGAGRWTFVVNVGGLEVGRWKLGRWDVGTRRRVDLRTFARGMLDVGGSDVRTFRLWALGVGRSAVGCWTLDVGLVTVDVGRNHAHFYQSCQDDA